MSMESLRNELTAYLRTLLYDKRLEFFGAAIGLIFAVSVLTFGFFKTFFVAICAGIGWYIGRQYKVDSELFQYWQNVINKCFKGFIKR